MEHNALFVDDDELLRMGYQLLSTKLDGKYHIHTADSGARALELLKERRFDVVVADLEMPGMDGLELLSRVLTAHPDCARIIVSGNVDLLKMAQCLFVGHRYVEKPCEPQTLADLLLRLASFRDVVGNNKVRGLIGGLGALPAPPDTFLKLEKLLQSDTCSLDDVAAIIEREPAVTVKLLQVANSAHFAPAQKLVTATEAAQFLGLTTVRGLVLGLQSFNSYSGRVAKMPPPPDLWDHSLRVATSARTIARAQGFSHATAERAFLAGLLHEVGKIVINANAPEDFKKALDAARHAGIPMHRAETEHFGATYADIGAYLLALWGIDEEVTNLVHNQERLDANGVTDTKALAALHVAHAADANDPVLYPLQPERLAALGFPDAQNWAA